MSESSSKEQTGERASRDDGVSGSPTDCRVTVERLGGIDETTVEVPPGVSLLVGRNATNRSSFLRAMAAALGGDDAGARLKTDTDSGAVQLTLGDQQHRREYRQTAGAVRTTGEPYTEESELVDTAVAVFADNPVRRAIRAEQTLREALMAPVNTAEIERRIDELSNKKTTLQEQLTNLEQAEQQVSELAREQTRLREELDEVDTRIETLEADLDETQAEQEDETAALQTELNQLRDQLGTTEQRIEQTAGEIEFRRDELDRLEQERDRLTDEIAEADSVEAVESKRQEVDSDIETTEQRRTERQRVIEQLQSVVTANQHLLESERLVLDDEASASLDPGSRAVECWTCGSTVEQAAIREQRETVRTTVGELRQEVATLEESLADLKQRRHEYERSIEQFEQSQERLTDLRERIDQHAQRIDELETELEQHRSQAGEYRDAIETVESEIRALETAQTESTTFIQTHEQLTELERERGRLETKLERTEQQQAELEEQAAERERVQTELETVRAELVTLRDRVDERERTLVETFNNTMSDLLDLLAFERIERVWVERQGSNDRRSSFELHIVRSDDDGAVYEDTVETLSESEREILGIVLAVVGYIVHDVDRQVPFLLLDSVEAIDGRRLATLLEYIHAHTDIGYLIVAVLPKEADVIATEDVLDPHVVPFDER